MASLFETRAKFMGATIFGDYYTYSVVNNYTGDVVESGLCERLAGTLAATLNKYEGNPKLEDYLGNKIWISSKRKVYVSLGDGVCKRLKTLMTECA